MNATRKVKAGFAVGSALLLAVGFGSIYQTRVWEDQVRGITRNYDTIQILDGVSLHSRTAVERARLFLLDLDQRHIAECWEELDSDRVLVERLERTLEVGELPEGFNTLRRLIDREYEVMAKNSPNARNDMPKALDEYARSGVVEEIDSVADEIRVEQNRLLKLYSQQQEEAADEMRILLFCAMVASSVVIVMAFWRSDLAHRRRNAAERALAAREEQYRQVVEGAGDIIYRTDAQGRFTYCNQTALTTLHFTDGEVLGRSYLKLIRHDMRQRVARFYLGVFARRKKNSYYEFPVIDGHGRERWIGQNVQLILDGSSVVGFQSIAREITERKKAEAEAQHARNFVERIADTTPGILYVFDLEEQRNIYENREMLTLLGYQHGEGQRAGYLLNFIIHPEDLHDLQRHHAMVRQARDGEVFRIEYRARQADGRWLWLASRDTPFARDDEGTVRQIVGIAQDVTQRKFVNDQLEYQANFDALTGLSNRHHFFLRLDKALRRASIDQSVLSACIMDIDHFKAINDHCGHSAGDEVLQTVGEIIRSELRTVDIGGRLGGDEFCIILVGSDAGEAEKVAERVRDRLTTLAFGLNGGSPFSVTATFGVAQAARNTPSRELLEAADLALYEAKHQGRNRTVVARA